MKRFTTDLYDTILFHKHKSINLQKPTFTYLNLLLFDPHSPNSSMIVCCDLNNKNTIKVESAEAIIDILLEDNTTRNGKSPNKTFLLEQNHQPVCTIYNEQVGINITFCSKCHCETHYKWSLLPSY